MTKPPHKPDQTHKKAASLRQSGVAAAKAGKHALAADYFESSLALDGRDAQTLNNLGLVLTHLGRFDDAIARFDAAILIRTNFDEAYLNRGNALLAARRPVEAVASFSHAADLMPTSFAALYNLAIAQKESGQAQAALLSYDKAIAIEPRYAHAHYNRGNVLQSLHRPTEAIASYEQAIALKSDFAEAYSNRGNALASLGLLAEAIDSYDRAIVINPRHARAMSNRGNALARLHRFGEAIASFDGAILNDPRFAQAYDNRANALVEMNRFEDALKDYGQAIALRPDLTAAYVNCGNALVLMKRYVGAIASYENAWRIDPTFPFLAAGLQYARMQVCDWRDFDGRVRQIERSIQEGRQASTPFSVLAMTDSAEIHAMCARTFAHARYPANNQHDGLASRETSPRIRIGYFSGDFQEHAVAHLIAGLIEQHDRSRFEVIALSSGPDVNDAMRQRLKVAFDAFIDIREMSDESVVALCRERQLDIAVDLSGFSVGGRMGVFARRVAPVQVNYLGYPGTTASGYHDYIVADACLVPPESRQHYTEKVVYLPDTYQPNDRSRRIDPAPVSRSAQGLPASGFVYCCFNNSFKITPPVFDSWMRILKSVEGSVLWLLEDNPAARANLLAQAHTRGVSPDRMVFARRVPVAQHLARHRLADLFLDTLPYNAHTTCSDALWAGVPVLTRIGESFPARVAAGLLRAAGLPELITESAPDYEALAIELARAPARLDAIRKKLVQTRLSVPLFDTARYTRNIEAAYAVMMDRFQSQQPADHIFIDPLNG